MTRLIDQPPRSMLKLKGSELLEAMKKSEGRVVVAEIAAALPPLVDGVSNAEMAAAFGADLVLLNLYDVKKPQVFGFPSKESVALADSFYPGVSRMMGAGVTCGMVKEWIGRPVGINLEPVPPHNPANIAEGRKATVENVRLALQQGADFIVLTGNPGTGVTTHLMVEFLTQVRAEGIGGLVWMAGKMHGAGNFAPGEPWMNEEEMKQLKEAGVDVILLPQPGTVPGVMLEDVAEWVKQAHQLGLMVMLTIGTSQEGATETVMENLALHGKMAGGDLFHIGDAGFSGMALPENITAYSIALKGKRHTYRRMAQSLLRS